ncbi:MAG: hypothetical protein FWC91_06315, partial [Defluviitaleaceae bacterium]|nr:hypothetical protein [Defluviitaleaceae bacterium]
IRGEFLDTFGFTPNMLTAEDMRMITLGISNSIDDNLFFGLAQWITRPNNHNDNYFYLKAKTTTTTLFIAHFGAVAGVSAVNAVNALRVAGASGKFALMTAPTGGGAAAGGVVAVGALVTAAGSAAVSVSAVLMMDRSVDLLGRDFSHLNTIRPPEHIDFAEEIVRETRDAIANNPDPSKSPQITSRFRLTQNEALDLGDRIMGSGFTEVGPANSPLHGCFKRELEMRFINFDWMLHR